MRITKDLIILATATLLLTIAAPSIAAEPLHIGAGLLNIGVGVRHSYSENFFLSSGDVDVDPTAVYVVPEEEESEWVTTARPEIQFGLPMDDFMLEAHGLLERTWHQEFDDEDSTSWLAGASLGADFPGGLSFRIGNDYEEGWLNTTQEFGPGEDYSRNEINFYLSFDVSDRFRVAGEYFNNKYDYDDSNDRDRTENVFSASAFWKFRPRTAAVVEYSHGVYEYDDDPAVVTVSDDNVARQIRGGLTWEATGKSTGFLKAGYQWKEYDEEDLLFSDDDRNNKSWVVGLDWNYRISSRTSSTLGVSREFVESSFIDNPHYITTGAHASLNHNFTRKLHAGVNVGFSRDAYPNDVPRGMDFIEREDDTTSLSANLGFDVFDWLTFGVEAGTGSRDSSLDEFDHENKHVAFLVRAGYGSVSKFMRRSE